MLAPVFGALGRATAWLAAGHGTRAKLVLNNWLADLTEATAETLSFARRLDLQDSGATLTLTSALLPRWRDTAASGHADDDLSAVYLTT